MEYICDICKEKVMGDSLQFISHNEGHIVDVIKKRHPEWIEGNGLCQKCLDYYREQLRG